MHADTYQQFQQRIMDCTYSRRQIGRLSVTIFLLLLFMCFFYLDMTIYGREVSHGELKKLATPLKSSHFTLNIEPGDQMWLGFWSLPQVAI